MIPSVSNFAKTKEEEKKKESRNQSKSVLVVWDESNCVSKSKKQTSIIIGFIEE